MRLAILGLLFGFAAANPTPTWKHSVAPIGVRAAAKRAAISEAATVGFATLNGGYVTPKQFPDPRFLIDGC